MHKGSEPPTITRLTALLAAGYRLDMRTTMEVQDTIWLEHPSIKRVDANLRTLMLHEDGHVSGMIPSKGEQLRIDPTDSPAFQALISSTPKPTWLEQHGPKFSHVFWTVVVWSLLLGFGFTFSRIALWVLHLL